MGRPRGFSEEVVLEGAAVVFVRGGYEGTSVDDLVTALQLHRGGLYTAFGSRRGLFLAVLRHCVETRLLRLAVAQGRPAITTEIPVLHLLTWITVAPITRTIRGITSEVPVGRRNGVDPDSVVSCDNIITVRTSAIGDTIGLLFDDQEPALARAISDAFDLFLP